jgi:hypothetical protein
MAVWCLFSIEPPVPGDIYSNHYSIKVPDQLITTIAPLTGGVLFLRLLGNAIVEKYKRDR